MKRAPPPEVWRLKFRDSLAHWSYDPPLAKYAYAATRYVSEARLREEKKRLRKQVADLKARLKQAHANIHHAMWPGDPDHMFAVRHAIDLSNKSWRKGGK